MLKILLPDRIKRGIVGAFFGSLLLLGLWLVRDYGVSFDEGAQRLTGQVSLLYVFGRLPTSWQQRVLSPAAVTFVAQHQRDWPLHQYRDRDYGVAFELPLAAAEQVIHLTDERQVYLLRHYCTLLVCLAGLAAFYVVAARRFGSWRLGLLGTLWLVLSPRLFADYFYNDKDAVFMSLWLMAVATAVPFIQRPTWRTAAKHALVCAIAIDVRIMGVLLPVASLAFVGIKTLRRDYRLQPTLGAVGILSSLLTFLVVVMWPYLWQDPLTNFVVAFRNMSHFRLLVPVLYQGRLLITNQLPWHYTLVWIAITTPLLYLLFSSIGLVLILSNVLTQRIRLFARTTEWQDLLFLSLAIVPILAVISLHSVLYSGWRQLYFIYPMLLLLALRGLVGIWHWQPLWLANQRYWQLTIGAILMVALLSIVGRMVRLHPFEHMYFNSLAPSQAVRYYEADYWGLSYRPGLEWLLHHDTRPSIRVYSVLHEPLALNRLMLPPNERQRVIQVASPEQADYYLRWSWYQGKPAPYPIPVYTVRAEDLPLLDIFRLR